MHIAARGNVVETRGEEHRMSDYPAPATYSSTDVSAEGVYARGAGWVGFAAIMLGLAGIWNALAGMLAIGDSRVFVGEQTFVFSDLNTWGWIILGLGVLQLVAAFAIVSGSEIARWFGIVVAGINAIGQLYFIPAYPFWALSIFAIDILIIYGLAVYGGKRLTSTT
jgi:hypothetical protein